MNQRSNLLPCSDHARCITSAIERAKSICTRQKVKLTALREAVLALVWQSHHPIKAYTIVNQIDTTIASNEPPNIYRSLDFLCSMGVTHKLHSLSAYIGCSHPEEHVSCILFYCKRCKLVQELCDTISLTTLQSLYARHSVQVEATSYECIGVCAECRRI